MIENNYKIVKLKVTEEGLQSAVEFFCKPYSLSNRFVNLSKITLQSLRWQYAENPLGECIGYAAYFKGKMVSHYATLPMTYSLNNENKKGLLALNLVTHPDHRGKGLFVKVASRTFEEAQNLGYEFVLGVANQNSTHGHIKKLGFDLISQLDVKLGFGNIVPDEGIDYSLKHVWCEDTMKWRLAKPFANYFKDCDDNVITPTSYCGIFAQLKSRLPYRYSLELMTKNGVHPKLWIGLAMQKRCKGIFVNMPHKILPSPLNLIYKNLKGDNEKYYKKDVCFELIDFDAY